MNCFGTKLHMLFFSCTLLITMPYCWSQPPLKRKVTFPSPVLATQLDCTPSRADDFPAPPITIWIHGSRLFPRTVFRSFFNNRPQLKLARSLNKRYYLRQIADTFIARDPQQFSYDTFYLLGWSGKISFSTRQEVAHVLYCQLKHVCAEYKKQFGSEPFVRIIAHSHGGNIALNLAREKQQASDATLHIAQLILLACPVQIKTQGYLTDSCFEKVYALYSALDFIQVLDPQGLYRGAKNTPIFSQRRFPSTKKLAQVKIQVNNRAITHAEFVMSKFLFYLPDIIQEINLWKEEELLCNLEKERVKLLCITTT